jgi:hypothetical protein
MSLTVVLIVLVVFLLGGWGYARNRDTSYGTPMGLLGLLLLIVLVVMLMNANL